MQHIFTALTRIVLKLARTATAHNTRRHNKTTIPAHFAELKTDAMFACSAPPAAPANIVGEAPSHLAHTARRTHASVVACRARIGVSIMLALLLAFCPFLAGCSSESTDETTQTHITISVWDSSVLSSGFATYIEEQNPSYDIEWIVGEDSLAFYEYQAEEGSLPDIILVNDMNEVSAQAISESLYTLDETTIVEGYSEEWLAQIPGNEEETKFVSAASGYEGILINEYLFELCDIEVPTSRESFIEACEAFAEEGFRGFVAGLADAETCYQVMQGFAEDDLITQTDDWLSQLVGANGALSVDDATFDDVTAYVNSLVETGIIEADDITVTPDEAQAAFLNGEAAMVFISHGQASQFASEHNMTVRALPFFGESSSWTSVKPAFYGAISNVQTQGVTTASDETIHAGAIEVLESIMSEEAQSYYLELNGIDQVVSAQGKADSSLPDALGPVEECLTEGRVRTYITNNTAIDSLSSALHGIVSGTLTSEQALGTVQEYLQESQSEYHESIVSFSEGISNLFSEEQGNAAAVDIAQVTASALDADCVVLSAQVARCPLYAGEKTADELAWPVAATSVYTIELTSAELETYITSCVEAAQNKYELPVLSGLHIQVSETDSGYELVSLELIVEGETEDSGQGTVSANEGREETSDLEAETTYTVAVSGYDWQSVVTLAETYEPKTVTERDLVESEVEEEEATGAGDASDLEEESTELETDTSEALTLQALWVSAFETDIVEVLPSYQDYFEFVE